ncbi:MAG TPA: ATP-binding protein [Flavobacteriales bacterium]|nr:ATP-binding protein [Flavobacteriales bacterium]HRP82870.1 ATP-binding protein [Flavobacteriales bacterium]HRQ85507.1 ATP-binding protein [Flavobacteriales bacterium]
MKERNELLAELGLKLRSNPVVMLIGPRQCGKTTLARTLARKQKASYFDLESPSAFSAMAEPYNILSVLRGLVIIDEAQHRPELFPVLRVLADRPRTPARFLLLGSASPELSRQASESLAGRVAFMEMRGFSCLEVGVQHVNKLWLRGGFPRAFLARSDAESMEKRLDFIQTFLQRDLAQLGFGMSPKAMGRFWTMLAHYHGQIWNASEIAGALGVSYHTANAYLDALEQTFMVRRVLPWFENTGKRLVKSPKIYFRDSGLLHALQRTGTLHELMHHPKLGASWEGFVLEEVVSSLKLRDLYFYHVHSGTELDLFFLHKGKRIGVEIKREDAPTMTKGMHVALADLKLDKLRVVYPGDLRYKLAPKVECVPFTQLGKLLE